MGDPEAETTTSAVRRRRRRGFRAARPGRFTVPSLVIIAVLLATLYVPRLTNLYLPSYGRDAALSKLHWDALNAGLEQCAELTAPPTSYTFPVSAQRTNPRWNALRGQRTATVLKNVTLFDGDTILDHPVDVLFQKGVVREITATGTRDYSSKQKDGDSDEEDDILILELGGHFVTPGLVDMHSHHGNGPWPMMDSNDDTNEVNPATGPLTPMVRAFDGIKPNDPAIAIIASGGVTSSLILPGSANIMGGEAVVIKNVIKGGETGEENIDELLLEYNVPKKDRRRYMKMACGENPVRVYKHTRMGNAWILRKQLARAKDLRDKQDAWCAAAHSARRTGDVAAAQALVGYRADSEGGGLPLDLELDSTVAMLRGKIGINIHCYEPEDMEDMIHHSEEFGFRIQAFHHALEAWKIPETLKRSEQNITIATFADFSLYKWEGYFSNLHAGKILHEHGVPVAYKSDHNIDVTNAKYLLSQAATAHSFGLPELAALQSVTSVPAKSLEQDHRIGFVKPGYDADIVVWNSHPLSVGAVPKQVFIDGKATLEKIEDAKVPAPGNEKPNLHPHSRREQPAADVQHFCSQPRQDSRALVITGITTSYVDSTHTTSLFGRNFTMVVRSGKMECFGTFEQCAWATTSEADIITLEDGYVLPGFTAISATLGLSEIVAEPSTGDGTANKDADPLDPKNVVYAKYGVHPEGRAFGRARIGGVTRAIAVPLGQAEEPTIFLGGVSVGIKTKEGSNPINGGIFHDDVALHFMVGQAAKASKGTPTISTAIAKLRTILSENQGKDTVYGAAADGKLPVVVHALNKYDIAQLIKVKRDYEKVNLIIYGGSEATSVAKELAAAKIPVIFTAAHGAPVNWEEKDMLVGLPLTKSPVQILHEANVTFALALPYFSDWHLQNLGVEASWAARDAGLDEREAVALVSTKIDQILGLSGSSKNRDIVIYEGNPLEYGANVVLSIDGDDGQVMSCWPEAM